LSKENNSFYESDILSATADVLTSKITKLIRAAPHVFASCSVG